MSKIELLRFSQANDNESDDDDIRRQREFEQRQRDIQARAAAFRGRSDLFFLALQTCRAMRIMQKDVDALVIERRGAPNDETLRRKCFELIEAQRKAGEHFDVLEAAMDEETRYKLWQHL